MTTDWRAYEKVILPEIDNLRDIAVYTRHGGYEMLRKALGTDRKELIDTIKAANIRGRGGAGFNAGLKWSFMPPKQEGLPRYLACNGDESEPGTFKDRRIFEFNPHLFIEGAIIACHAMQMDAAYVYVRGEYADWIDLLQAAVDQAYAQGFAGKNILGATTSCGIKLPTSASANRAKARCASSSAWMTPSWPPCARPPLRPAKPTASTWCRCWTPKTRSLPKSPRRYTYGARTRRRSSALLPSL